MLNLAQQNHAQVILAIGKRLPRWPECHEPGWASNLSAADEQNAQLSYMETVVQKYYNNTVGYNLAGGKRTVFVLFRPLPAAGRKVFLTKKSLW